MALKRSSAKPNVLIFCVDQMRADYLSCAGNPVVKTPNLDSLASRGVIFQRSYCNNPICMPARATMFTGLLPRDHGLRTNGQFMRPDLPTLLGVLAGAGYRTHAAGKLHLTPWVPNIDPPAPAQYPECLQYWNEGIIKKFPVPYYGFQTVDFVGGHTTYAYGDYIRWLSDQGGKREMLAARKTRKTPSAAPGCYQMALPEELHYNRYIADSTIRLFEEVAQTKKPFFAWCSFPDPHPPLAPPAPYYDMYNPKDMPQSRKHSGDMRDPPLVYTQILAGELRQQGNKDAPAVAANHLQEMMALTYGMITHVDHEIGRVLKALQDRGLADETMVVFLSDHGDMMGDHGLIGKGPFTFQGCVRIPTIVSAPDLSAGRLCPALISQIDLLPSILDYCAIPAPGSNWATKDGLFAWGQIQPLSVYPGKSWIKLLKGELSAIRAAVVIEDDDLPTGYHLRCLVTETHRLTIYPGTGDGELFDLCNDPDESHNLWYRPEANALKSALSVELLQEYSRQTPFYPVPPWNA
ncbi:MAG: sulfatase-like hydrolase/transferase [Lentisphaerae bacterium]|nr:sulfatase-like hydrolase/transferase [Lentisphaerota bacterium]